MLQDERYLIDWMRDLVFEVMKHFAERLQRQSKQWPKPQFIDDYSVYAVSWIGDNDSHHQLSEFLYLSSVE